MHKHLHTFFLSLIAIYVFGFEYLPLQDYPNWLYHGYVFNQYVFHGDTFGGFFHLYHYLPPNAICTLGIGCLSLIISPLLAGKLFLFATAVILNSGIASYISFHLKDQPVASAIAAFYFVFNLNFLMGFLNYCFGLGLALFVIVYIEKNDLHVNRIYLSLMLLLLYLTHCIALGIVILFVAVYASHSKKYKDLISLLPSFLPVILLFIHYEIAKPLTEAQPTLSSIQLIWRIHLVLYYLYAVVMPFHGYRWVQETTQFLRNFNYVFCGLLTSMIVYAFLQAKKKNLNVEFRLLIILLLLIIFLPGYFGGVMMPATRFSTLFAITVIIINFRTIQNRILRKASIALIFCLSLASYEKNMENAYRFDQIVSSGVVPLDAVLLRNFMFEGTDGFEQIQFYHGIRHHEALRMFKSGLFDYSNAGMDNLGYNPH